MVWLVALTLIGLALSPRTAAQQNFPTQASCTASCVYGSCSEWDTEAWVCLCKSGYTGSTCDSLQSSGNSEAPAEAPGSEAPVLAPTPAPMSLLDCGLGAHALDNNGVPYCNCDGTGRSGVNCQLGAPAPAPVPGVSSPSTGTPGPSTAYAPVSFPTSSVSAKAPTIASELPPTGASYVKGACPAGQSCVTCNDGGYCLNGGTCLSYGNGCDCVTFGPTTWGGGNCQTKVNTNSVQAKSGQTATSPSAAGSHISGVGVALIVISVLAVVAVAIAAFAFWKARGRTSKFDRFADQPEIFRGATNNL
ncbi:hypothetical protein WJX84_000059 [Apatococcus fuscideae]|uniref:EGF-like domain-containing protein n=1 Tax=Apatococcus fuscideae TaxID=2026836 RepID=A0AAW1TIX6_9CHLO